MTRVAVIGGGRSSEHEVSLASAAAVADGLKRAAYEVVPLTVTRDGAWLAGVPISLTDAVATIQDCDVVFPALHGPHGEDGTLAALCEVALVPYVGCGVGAGAIGMHKWATQLVAESVGVVTARGRRLTVVAAAPIGSPNAGPGTGPEVGALRNGPRPGPWTGPCVVKPLRAGSSHGVTLVTHESDLASAVAAASRCDSVVLVEPFVIGREIDLGVIEQPDGTWTVLPPLEIGRTGIFDSMTKYDGSADFQVPAVVTCDEADALTDAALRIVDALGCRGLARVDFFLTPAGPVLNEVNTMPGLTPHSQLPRMAAAAGLAYPQLLDCLVTTALARRQRGPAAAVATRC